MRSEVWLYGSVARGSHTSQSDLDILVLPRGGAFEELPAAVNDLPQREFCSVTSYSWLEIQRMAEYGSLFLLHLQLEGRLLQTCGDGLGLESILDGLPPYARKHRELNGFLLALDDGVQSLEEGGDVRFELGVAGRVIRHASILTSYLAGSPKFDRQQAIALAFSHVNMRSEIPRALALTTEIRRRPAQSFPVLPPRQEAIDLFEMAKSFVGRVAAEHGAA